MTAMDDSDITPADVGHDASLDRRGFVRNAIAAAALAGLPAGVLAQGGDGDISIGDVALDVFQRVHEEQRRAFRRCS